jgi:hypothetical protein
MARPESEARSASDDAVADYKRILADVLEKRPSGTRQRLATALGKNRSFVSQICNPAYQTPIPASHLETIIEVCHFPADARRRFLAAYARAHPRRPVVVTESHRHQAHTFYLPDLGDDERNRQLHEIVNDFVRRLAILIQPDDDHSPGRPTGKSK